MIRELLERLAARARDRGQGLLAIVHGASDREPFDEIAELRDGLASPPA